MPLRSQLQQNVNTRTENHKQVIMKFITNHIFHKQCHKKQYIAFLSFRSDKNSSNHIDEYIQKSHILDNRSGNRRKRSESESEIENVRSMQTESRLGGLEMNRRGD